MNESHHPDIHDRESRAAALKERIYLTFASLAVVIALTTHGHAVAADAILTLAVTATGLLLSMFVADIISHILVQERFPTRGEYRHAIAVTFGAMGAIAVPFGLLAVSHITGWSAESALKWSAVWLLLNLIAIGFVAMRKLELTRVQQIVVLGAEAGLGVVVIGLQILAHGG